MGKIVMYTFLAFSRTLISSAIFFCLVMIVVGGLVRADMVDIVDPPYLDWFLYSWMGGALGFSHMHWGIPIDETLYGKGGSHVK